MKRVVLSIVTTVTGLVALFQFKSQPVVGSVLAGGAAGRGSGTVTAAASSGHRSGRHSSPTRASSALGGAVSTPYGPVQVRVTASGGRISSVTAVQLPSAAPYSQRVAAYAVPVLRREVMQADSARVSVVSGATYTSEGYLQSVQSALDQLQL